MKHVRLWIILLAVVSFVAGTATGHIVSERTHQPRFEPELAAFERHFVETFELSDARAEHLRTVLSHYEREVARVKDEHLASYHSAIEPQLRELGNEYNRYLRDKVLPADQRTEFDRQCAPLLTLAQN